jgi:hypothetical protein
MRGFSRRLRGARGSADAASGDSLTCVRFGRKRGDGERAPEAETYVGLRQQVLALQPDQIGLASDTPVTALLMETGYPAAVATLVAVVDGTTSLYFSNGGGIIGAGSHPDVAAATERWLRTSTDLLPHLSPVDQPPLPGEGLTQFVAVTPNGLFSVAALEDELGEGGHPLSAFFYSGQDVITQIRLAETKA